MQTDDEWITSLREEAIQAKHDIEKVRSDQIKEKKEAKNKISTL